MSTDLAIIRDEKPYTTVSYASPSLAQRDTPKLVTRFASIFFSDYDSIRDRGTNFMIKYRTGQILTAARLRQQFAIAASEVIRQLGDQSAYPAEVTLVRAYLEDAQISTNYEAYLRVKLFTPLGETTITYPVERVS